MPIKSFVSVLLALGLPFFLGAQQKQNWLEGTADPDDADRSYIRKFVKTNDARGFFKVQNTRVEFGSTKEGSKLNRRGFFKNSTNQVGLGLSYKIFGAEISFFVTAAEFGRQQPPESETIQNRVLFYRPEIRRQSLPQ
jgi:hypothetical protein